MGAERTAGRPPGGHAARPDPAQLGLDRAIEGHRRTASDLIAELVSCRVKDATAEITVYLRFGVYPQQVNAF
jgi:hypothetical protein